MIANDWKSEPGEESVVTKVANGSITQENGWSIFWRDDAGPIPNVGDRVKVCGEIGYPFYGLAVNGELRWWLTSEQREQRLADELAKLKADREARWVEAEPKLDADYDDLPAPFRFRIDQLRARGGREWRVEMESYEMFCLTEAVKIAERFGSRAEIARWNKLPYADQRAEWDGFDDGHSGNTFGAACSLAALWCDAGMSDRAEALVVQPQAMAPIAGDPRY